MSEPTERRTVKEVADEPPPFLGKWGRVYAAVLLYLFTLIALFWVFGRIFTP